MAGEKTYGTPIQEVEIDGVYHKIEGSSSGGLTEISTQYIRITDLETGVYKLTYNGTKYIYYHGTTNTNTHTVTGGSGAVILTVNRYSTTHWHWYYINGTTGYETIYYGWTSTSSGLTGSKSLNLLLTSHLYRPIQVNGTQILANSASTALNLSNDGNVKFTQVSGGTVKADADMPFTKLIEIDTNSVYLSDIVSLNTRRRFLIVCAFTGDNCRVDTFDRTQRMVKETTTGGGFIWIEFRDDWRTFVYDTSTNNYRSLENSNDIRIMSTYGPLFIYLVN